MKRLHTIIGFVLLTSIGYSQTAIAQVSTDGTVGTIVSPGLVFNITGGTRPSNGPNLFHSFSQFSLPTGSSAIFQNDPNVQTIFSRVTGGSRSDINGTIQTQGGASLFLMNPNGIVFGPNAKLELGGSFVGTTANSIKFEDGIEFSSGNLTANPLLSVKVPIGLQMGSNPGAIAIQGIGHSLVSSNGGFTPLDRVQPNSGLEVQVGQTLGLIGGDISLSGGILTASGGQIVLGSARGGTVELNSTLRGWQFHYNTAEQLGNIELRQRALVDASGNGGAIHLQGKQISFSDTAIALIQHAGNQIGGKLTLNASESITFLNSQLGLRTGAVIETTGIGRGGDINVSAPRLLLQNGSALLNTSFASGGAGNIVVNASDSVQLVGSLPNDLTGNVSRIDSSSLRGNVGNVSISTAQLTLRDGGTIASASFGEGNGGNISIQATESIDVSGVKPSIFFPSVISASTSGGGNAGNLLVETKRLTIQDGGRVDNSTFAGGNAGSLTIKATEWVDISGEVQGSRNPSLIVASGNRLDPALQLILRQPAMPSGDSGTIILNSPQIRVSRGAAISVQNEGKGRSGKLQINAEVIALSDRGQITATSASGEGGELELRTDHLQLRQRSLIVATAAGLGVGGNISIDSPTIVGLENSDIAANAFEGRGGNIKITTQGIIGLKYRDRLTPDNDITASSEFGINGNVQVNTIGINPTNTLNALPVVLVDSSRQISDRCAAAKTSSFISTGRGGIPQSPRQTRKSDRTWHDLRDTRTDRTATTTVINPVSMPIAQVPIVEASALRNNSDGSIELVAPMPSSIDSGATCAIQ